MHISLIFMKTVLNENNEQFGENVVVGLRKPDRSFSNFQVFLHIDQCINERLNITKTIKMGVYTIQQR